MPKILVYPPDRNPYQRLLYGAMRAAHPELAVAYCAPVRRLGALGVPLQLLAARLRGFDVLHVHWPDFRVPRWVPFRRSLAVRAPGAVLRFARRIGLAVVWTVHEVVPHDPRTVDDTAVARDLARVADALIVHSPGTLAELERRRVPHAPATVIPHGSFIDGYGDAVEKTAARAALGLPEAAFVVLAFGLIRPYKGLDDLIDAVRDDPDPTLRLVIAGRALDRRYLGSLRARAGSDERIRLDEGHVADEDVPVLFGACDVVAAPFRSVTTSGSAMLALSFGRPLLAPRTGNIADLPAGTGIFYDADEPGALAASLHAARNGAPLDEIGRAARAFAEALSWPAIASATWEVYEQAIERRRA